MDGQCNHNMYLFIFLTYSATTPTKATRQNSVQISEWKPWMLTIDFLQIIDLSKLHTTEAINLQRICLGGLGWSSRTINMDCKPQFKIIAKEHCITGSISLILFENKKMGS